MPNTEIVTTSTKTMEISTATPNTYTTKITAKPNTEGSMDHDESFNNSQDSYTKNL